MSEVNARGMAALGKESVFAGQRGDMEERSEETRQLAEGSAPRGQELGPNPEVPVCAKRRRFPAAYKASPQISPSRGAR